MRAILVLLFSLPVIAQQTLTFDEEIKRAARISGAWVAIVKNAELDSPGEFPVKRLILAIETEIRKNAQTADARIAAAVLKWDRGPRIYSKEIHLSEENGELDSHQIRVKWDKDEPASLDVTFNSDKSQITGFLNWRNKLIPIVFNRPAMNQNAASPFQGDWAIEEQERSRKRIFRVQVLKESHLLVTFDQLDGEQAHLGALARGYLQNNQIYLAAGRQDGSFGGPGGFSGQLVDQSTALQGQWFSRGTRFDSYRFRRLDAYPPLAPVPTSSVPTQPTSKPAKDQWVKSPYFKLKDPQ